MGNVLRMEKKQQIQVLACLGWSNRAISRETGIDRDTVSRYRTGFQNPPEVPFDPPAGVEQDTPKVPADSGLDISSQPPLPRTNSSALRPHVERIGAAVAGGLSAQRIYQDIVEQYGYAASYDSVKRYVRKLRKRSRRYRERLEHPPGREMQVDFGKATCRVTMDGKLRRPWLFKATLSCSKHALRPPVRTWGDSAGLKMGCQASWTVCSYPDMPLHRSSLDSPSRPCPSTCSQPHLLNLSNRCCADSAEKPGP